MPEDASQPAPRPKRRYTVSAKVLAANRRNLEKANAVPKEIRYRLTPKRAAACRQNLRKSRAARPPLGPFRRALHRARQKLPGLEDCLRKVSRILDPQDLLQASAAEAIGEVVWRWLAVLRNQCEEERRTLTELWQWAWPRSDTIGATRLALRFLRVFARREPLAGQCELFAAQMKKLGQSRYFESRRPPSDTPREAPWNPINQAFAAGLGNPFHPDPQAASPHPHDQQPEASATQAGPEGMPSPAASSPETNEPAKGVAAEPEKAQESQDAPAAPADDKPPAWLNFEEYQKRVQGAQGAHAALEPRVQEIARLSWERHQLFEDWAAQAKLRLDDLLRRTPSPCPASELTAKLEETLRGPAMERVGAEGARLEAELRATLGKYLFERYGLHNVFTLIAPLAPPPDADNDVVNSAVAAASRRPGGKKARKKLKARLRRARRYAARSAASHAPAPPGETANGQAPVHPAAASPVPDVAPEAVDVKLSFDEPSPPR